MFPVVYGTPRTSGSIGPVYQSGGASVGLALVAGESAWADVTDPATGTERLIAYLELVALAVLVSSLWVMMSSRTPDATGLAAILPLVGTAAAVCFAVRPTQMLLNRRREANVWWSIVWRGTTTGLMLGALVANAPDWGVLAVWPVGVVAGAEATLCAWRIGIPVSTLGWYRAFLTSSLHLGVIGAAIAAIVRLGGLHGWAVALSYLLMVQIIAIVACGTAGMLENVRRQQLRADQATAERTSADEHRRRAHWLHDDVSAQLRIVSVRVQSGAATTADVVGLLDGLDHQLRLRQLDELLASGTARLAEVIQPYVRNAQGHGIEITDVPRFEDASLMVNEATGRNVARAAAVFTTNAIQAGATRIGFTLRHEPAWIELSVTDDAGGFNIADIPAGRALWELSQDPSTHSLTSEHIGNGTVVSIRLSTGHHDPQSARSASTSNRKAH